MKTKTTISGIIAALVFVLMTMSAAHAAYVQSVKAGEWTDGTVWSTGSAPNTSDDISIRHSILKNGNLLLGSNGRITVEQNAKLHVAGNFENHGFVINHDSMIVYGFASNGSLENYGTMVDNGNFDNQQMGSVSNFGTIRVQGNLIISWKFWTSGQVFVNGNVDNYSLVLAPDGSIGYFEVCGNVTHHSSGQVSGTVYLCLKCNGHYDADPGHTGDFILQCNPLAATITDFRAEVSNEATVNLSWVTQTEANVAWFVVERSSPESGTVCKFGKCGEVGDFIELGRIAASGNSQSPLNYQYTDAHPIAGQNYYRIRIVDQNGQVSYSTIIEAMAAGEGVKLLAYPNPNHSILHIQATGYSNQKAVLTLYSIDGKRVWEKSLTLGEGPFRYDMQTCDFASGVYLLKLQQGNKEEVRKLIFEK
ncbi:MAG: hypothetical protein RLZZ519_2523 [Bacteroidota bacterium]|jgi:flagellin-like protein